MYFKRCVCYLHLTVYAWSCLWTPPYMFSASPVSMAEYSVAESVELASSSSVSALFSGYLGHVG